MKFIVFMCVVILLGSAQWPTASSVPDGFADPPIILDDDLVPLELNFPLNGKGEVLYQGDMMLTDEQWRSLLQRKAIADESYRWPKTAATGMVDIDYRYDDAVVSRPGVQKATATWEAATCVRFHEVPSAVAKPHLIFKTHADACNSNVGYISSQNGQDVNLAPSCFTGDDVTVHELGHALGLQHEQSRSDRDDYVTIMLENVKAGMEHNFNKEVTNNYGLPYDYSSIMHYFPTAFSKNGLYTLLTKDPLAMPLIERTNGLSFMDKKIVNLMYKCTGTWLVNCSKTTDPCQNQGYTKSDCTCECPAGTSGANCETLNLPYTEALIQAKSPGSQRITAEGTVTSPGYPTPLTTDSTPRLQSIEAPECHKVQLTFNVFDLYEKVNLTSSGGGPSFLGCWFTILDIKLDDPPVTGNEYCGGDFAAPKTFESVGRFMVLTYTTKALAGSTKTGYSATVKFIPVAGCTTTATIATTASTTTPTTTLTITPTTTSTTTPTTTSTTTPTTTPTTTSTTTPTTTSTTTPTTTSTTTAAPNRGKIINSGRLPLKPSKSSGKCSLVSSANPSVYFYRSPNFPNKYGRGQECMIWFHTTEPRYLKVTPKNLKLGSSDIVSLFYPYKTTTNLNAGNVGTAITVPTSSSQLTFKDSTSSPTGKFNIRIQVVNNDCHQLIKLDAQSTGPLSIPANYPPETVCEWWLRAPAGRKVQVTFSRFSIGGKKCRTDYVVIDRSGDSRYVTNSKRYCGGNAKSPGTVVSTGNALNILVNGQQGNYRGLKATYKVV